MEALCIKGYTNIILEKTSWILTHPKQARDCLPAAAQRRRRAAFAAVFAVVSCPTQLAEPRLCNSRYFLPGLFGLQRRARPRPWCVWISTPFIHTLVTAKLPEAVAQV
eukprot:5098968-Pleurochrysis_carterae.AAC.3